MIILGIEMAYKTKCVVKKPLSMSAFVVVGASAAGTMLYPQNAPVGAVVGGLLAFFVLTTVKL